MTDKKLSDNLSNNSPIFTNGLSDSEIVKALECCSKPYNICAKCPIPNDIKDDCKCGEHLANYALDLINRLRAENERLKNAYKQCAWERDTFLEELKTAKAEAYKEFGNKIKVHAYYIDFPKEHRVVDEDDIDNLLKEMVGEDK